MFKSSNYQRSCVDRVSVCIHHSATNKTTHYFSCRSSAPSPQTARPASAERGRPRCNAHGSTTSPQGSHPGRRRGSSLSGDGPRVGIPSPTPTGGARRGRSSPARPGASDGARAPGCNRLAGPSPTRSARLLPPGRRWKPWPGRARHATRVQAVAGPAGSGRKSAKHSGARSGAPRDHHDTTRTAQGRARPDPEWQDTGQPLGSES
jgi:hypothetical protein